MDGNIYPPSVLDIKEEDVLSHFKVGVSNLTAISLGSGYVTPAAAPHLIMHSFKNLAAIAFATEFSFPQADALKNAASSAPKQAAAPEAKKEAEKEPEP